METLSSFLQNCVKINGPRPALLTGQEPNLVQWSYDDLYAKVRVVANWLLKQGIEKGERVLIWAPNSPWWVASYFACHQIGAMVVPIDTRSSPDFVNRVTKQSEPKLAIVGSGSGGPLTPSVAIEDLAKLPDGGEPMPHCHSRPDDIALLMFTSGTTGDPKGVKLTHRNILTNVDSSNDFVPFLKDYRLLSLLPLSHMFEQTLGLLTALSKGGSIFYPSSLQPNVLFGIFEKHAITILVLVPQVLKLFMDAIEREIKKQGKQKLWDRMLKVAKFLPYPARRLLFRQVHKRLGGKVRFFTAGGAFLDPQLAEKWNRVGIRVIQGYGLTEAAPVVTGTPLSQKGMTSVGKILRGVEMKIAEDGEILIKGDSITAGYWNNIKATNDAIEDGWFKTGDLGYLDKKGSLYLHGRKKDMIVLSNGKNVYPEDVENALKQVPGIKEAVVLGYPEGMDPEVHAALLLEPEVNNPAQLVKQANKTLAPFQYIKGYTVWTETDFPRTHTLKIKKRDVLKQLTEIEAAKSKSANETIEA